MIPLATITKPSKKVALNLSKRVAKGEILDAINSALLINYFTATPKKKVKNSFDWVAQVCNKDDVREFIHYVSVLNGVMRATDGNRIHTAITDLEDGFYCPKTGLKLTWTSCNFPDLSRVTPSYRYDAFKKIVDITQTFFLDEAVNKQVVRFDGEIRYHFNAEYIEQAAPMSIAWDNIGGLACRGISKYGEFVIMPCRNMN